MARRYWTNPKLKSLLSGDKVLARTLEKRARACVGYLFDQLTPNQKYRTQAWNYGNGSRIQAYVWNDVLGKRAVVKIFHPKIEETFGVVTGLTFYMEHGWSMWSTLDPTNMRVYPDSNVLDAHTTGVDVSARLPIPVEAELPDGCVPSDLEVLRGRLNAILFNPPTTGTAVWCEGLPTLDAESSYSWTRGENIENERTKSHLDTGEMRFVRQALHGAGKNWSSILSSVSLTDSPSSIGIVIDKGETSLYSTLGIGNYWLYSITENGCYLVPMSLSSTIVVALTELLQEYKDDETSVEFRMLLAYVLSTLSIPAGTPVFTVLTSDDMIPVYANSASQIAHGWHGFYQPGAGDGAGIISTLTYTDGSNIHYSRTAEVTITWNSGGVPNATLDVTSDVAWGGGDIRLRVPASNGLLQIFNSGATITSGIATIYSFTTPDGVAHLRKHPVVTGAGVQTQAEPSWPSFCGAGSDSAEGWYNRQWGQTTGFSVTGAVDASGVHDGLILEYRQYKYAYVNGGGGTIESRDKVTYPSDYLFVGTGICDAITKKYCDNSNDGPWTVSLASDAGSEYTIWQKDGGSFKMMACILPTDTGVIVGYLQNWGRRTTYGNSTTHWDHSTNQLSISTEDQTNGLIRSHSSLHTHAITVTDPTTGSGINVDEGYYQADVYGTNPWDDGYEYGVYEGEFTLVSSAGEEIALNLDDWVALAGDSLQTNSPYVLVSANGETVSTPSLGEYQSTIPGVDGDKFSGVFLPVGVA